MEGKIKELLNERSSGNKKIKELVDFIDRIEDKVKSHLARIIEFLPHFDSHDIKHSQAVLKNMESLLGDKLSALSTMELFFLYTTALLHDCGMALSIQEFNVLLACEGKQEDLSVPKFGLDEKKKPDLRKMKDLISRCRQKLYPNLIDTGVYTQQNVFGFYDENKLIEHLADLALKYQSFRNGHLPNIKMSKNSNMEEINKSLRGEFIRSNHALLSKIYCHNTEPCFDAEIMNNYGDLFSKIIGELCLSHDLDFKEAKSSLEKLPGQYFDNEKADLEFISAMLRVADVLHFSADRVSNSLSYEKGTNNNIHWVSKLTGLNFTIVFVDNSVEISANAPCSKPEEYYFIKNYIKYVEGEIINLIKCKKTNELGIKIQDKVDVCGLVSTSDEFTPADELCIKMDQSNIIELLMGEELYKDKFACIRELYQNSLDACRCLQLNSPDYVGKIEFGIDKCFKHGIERRYLYCIDNGIGMDMHIIQDYLLHIGHTFYSSSEFHQMRANSDNKFYPVSQFGVGILSCFMLCDLLEITTKRENGDCICLTLDGKNEHLYFSTPQKEDEEQIGKSGTIVKLYLTQEIPSDNMPSNKVLNEILMYQSIIENKFTCATECDAFLFLRYKHVFEPKKETARNVSRQENQYLFTIIKKYIKLTHKNVEVFVRCQFASGKKGTFYKLVNLNDYCVLELDIPYIQEECECGSQGIEYISKHISTHKIKREEVKEDSENLLYRNMLYFPKDIDDLVNYQSLLFKRVLEFHKSGFLIDGIAVQYNEESEFDDSYEGDYTLNFVGKVRPKLSIDRLNILDISKELTDEWAKLREKVAQKEIRCICNYIDTIPYNLQSQVSNIMWNYYFTSRYFLFPEIVKCLMKSDYKISWNDLSENIAEKSNFTLFEFFTRPIVHLKHNINYTLCSTFFKTIVAHKAAMAEKVEICDDGLLIFSLEKKINKHILFNKRSWYSHRVYRRSDYSKTIYRQYDIVNSLFPMINEKFFDLLAISNKTLHKKNLIVGKEISDNHVFRLYEIDSLCVHHNVLYSREHFGEYQLKYLLKTKSINGPYMNRKISQDKKFLIYAFISPALTEEQRQYIETLKSIDSEYYNGALNGWSVLFTEDYEIVTLPGIRDIKELLIRIPDSYWADNERKSYLTDNTEITPEMIQQLRNEMNYDL